MLDLMAIFQFLFLIYNRRFHQSTEYRYLCRWHIFMCAIPTFLCLIHRFLCKRHNFLDEVHRLLCHVHRFLCTKSQKFSHYLQFRQEGNGILKNRFNILNPWNVLEFWFWVANEDSTLCQKRAKISCVRYTENCAQGTGFWVPYTEFRIAHTEFWFWNLRVWLCPCNCTLQFWWTTNSFIFFLMASPREIYCFFTNKGNGGPPNQNISEVLMKKLFLLKNDLYVKKYVRSIPA